MSKIILTESLNGACCGCEMISQRCNFFFSFDTVSIISDSMEVDCGPVTDLPFEFAGEETKPDPDFSVLEEKTDISR
jgi:hypothetical protein